jgi:spore germination protein
MVITNIGVEGRFDSDLAHTILSNEDIQDRLISNILSVMKEKGYGGLNVDFEYVYPSDKDAYINFLNKVKTELKKENYFLTVALAPKYSDEQVGLLYEAHDYEKIGALADHVILMTYEWGYSGGPSRAVAPINLVERVLDYATKKIPNNKILLGIPNYGYDWTLPYVEGNLAKSVGNYEAVDIANYYKQSINYNYEEQAPYFNYYDSDLIKHEVWFEDARSIQAKLELVIKYNIEGVSYWTINRFFPQNYLILNNLFVIRNH